MKAVVILADGMADYPCPELGGKTPLEYAHTPFMNALAAQGEVGMVRTVPEGLPPGSDVANLSVLGYDPRRYYTGRAPFEAAGMGIELRQEDVAFRCNLVTVSGGAGPFPAQIMRDYSAGEVTTAEAQELINAVQARLGRDDIKFFPGVSYRHLMVWRRGPTDTNLTPPHDITGRVIGEYLPRGPGGDVLTELMAASADFLHALPVNLDRVAAGKKPANSIWFWGQGVKPRLIPFKTRFGLAGSVIAAVDLIKGIGTIAGMRVPVVPGATGNIHTDYRAKARVALAELAGGQDFVFIHVEAPDEAGHQGDAEAKVKAIEKVDAELLGEVLAGLRQGYASWRLLLLPDHPTPLALRTHTDEPVPFLIADYHRAAAGGGINIFSEAAARKTGMFIADGWRLLDYFVNRGHSGPQAARKS